MEELIKKIKELVEKQKGLTPENVVDFETAVIEEMIKVESVSELIREQPIIDEAEEDLEEEAGEPNVAKAVIADFKEGDTDQQIKNKYRKADLVLAAEELKAESENDTKQGYIDAIRKALEPQTGTRTR